MSARDALSALWEKWRPEFEERTHALEDQIATLLDAPDDAEARETGRAVAHKLAGTVGTYGIPLGSTLAKEIEHILEADTALDAPALDRLSDLVVRLGDAIAAGPDAPETPKEARAPAPSPAATSAERSPSGTPSLFVAGGTEEARAALAKAAHAAGWDVEAHDWDVAQENAPRPAERPTVAVLHLPSDAAHLFDPETHGHPNDTSDPLHARDGPPPLLSMLPFLAGPTPVPLVVLGDADSLGARVEAVHAGASAFLPSGDDPVHVFSTAAGLAERAGPSEARILSVDDDPMVLDLVRCTLEPAGYRVTTLADPLRFWDVLAELHPDMVLLDVDMPGFHGIDLCRAVRSDPDWNRLPILFLTSRSDPDSVARMFSVGADDFIPKPIQGPELLPRLENRLRRIRSLQAPAATSPATPPATKEASRGTTPTDAAPRTEDPTTDVLLVDDDPTLADILRHALNHRGLRVEWCDNGRRALELLGADGGMRPRLVLLDVNMPGMDGLTVLRSLREGGRLEHLHVIMLTARSSEAEVVDALRLGATDHIAKPFSVQVLQERITRALGG